jgi:hypothetical protein
MKKGTRTWKLWAVMLMYFWLMGITATLYGEYIVSRDVNGFTQLLATGALLFLVGFSIARIVNLLTRILKRKQLW